MRTAHQHNHAAQSPTILATGRFTFSALSKLDPSKTGKIQLYFMREAARRVLWLKQVIRGALVEKDVLGIGKEVTPPITLAKLPDVKTLIAQLKKNAFAFPRSDKKVAAFMRWLEEMEDMSLLEITYRPGAARGFEEAWSDVYIRHAYQKGIAKAREELRAAGYTIPSFSPDDAQDVAIAFNQPFHADRVGLAFTRSFNDLKGITRAMDAQISRVLADGLAAGYGPLKIAKEIADRVDKIGLARAKTLARTEVMKAHHSANMGEYRQAQAEGVELVAEWATAADPCPKCSALAKKKYYSLDDAEMLLPVHPNCRCAMIPVPMVFVPKDEARRIRRALRGNELEVLGGKGSGNWGHTGTPGRGGSPKKGVRGSSDVGGSEQKKWRGMMVDAELKEEWMEKLNSLPGVNVTSMCSGHREGDPHKSGGAKEPGFNLQVKDELAAMDMKSRLEGLGQHEVEVSVWAGPAGNWVVRKDGKDRLDVFTKEEIAKYPIDRISVSVHSTFENKTGNQSKIAKWWDSTLKELAKR
jgi:SPP1 gp7 family putative phage head morphogenesis protein